jgi:hypothetical protein
LTLVRLRSLVLAALTCTASRSALAQTAFTEVEPNSERAEATLIACLANGDTISGTTTGTSVLAGDASFASADVYRLQLCAQTPGIVRHELALVSATAGQTPTLRGLVQAGAPGSGGMVTTTDATFSAGVGLGTPASPRVCAWYGFGAQAELYWRVAGTGLTPQPYTATFTSTPVSASDLGNFVTGAITITSLGQGHISDTELWLYDANLNALPLAGNDDALATTTVQSLLTRTLAPGTYHLAVAGYNLANNLPSPVDDDSAQGHVLDFPDVIASSRATSNYDVSFAISDAGHTLPVQLHVNAARAQEIAWFRFVVLAPFSEPFCFGDGTQVQPCPCGNAGATGHGCANSVNAQGALLDATGTPDPDTLTLTCSGTAATATVIFLKTDAPHTGYVFGDGVRCVDGALIRLKQRIATGGVSTFPLPGDPLLSVRGQTPPGSASIGYYQAYYRNASSTFCTPATFNITNGWRVVW